MKTCISSFQVHLPKSVSMEQFAKGDCCHIMSAFRIADKQQNFSALLMTTVFQKRICAVIIGRLMVR